MNDPDPHHRIAPDAARAASRRIAGHVRRTPLWRLPGAALGVNCAELWQAAVPYPAMSAINDHSS